MEQVKINFSKFDLENGIYKEMIYDSVKNYFFPGRNIEYIFPQIKKGGQNLKNDVANNLKYLNIKGEFNVWFMTTKVEESVFKIIFLNNK